MKILHLTALDGSEWHIPLEPVSRAYAAYLKTLREFANDTDEQVRAHVEQTAGSDLIDFARNDMDWSDVKEQAVMVKAMDPEDMADSWVNGKMRVIERVSAPAPRPAAGATVEHYKCRRCSLEHSTDQAPPTCAKGPCPMELRGVTVAAPRDVQVTVSPEMLERAAAIVGVTADAAFSDDIEPMALAVRASHVLTHDEMVRLYNTMPGAQIIANVAEGDRENAILEAYGRRVILAAVEKAAKVSA
jgi:hypothetical protein